MTCILVVEDEKDLQVVLGYNLRLAGYDVLAAMDGAAAIRLARERHPDLVLLDLMLPDMSGTEVCKALKKDPETAPIPVVMLTARGEEVDRIVGFEIGAEDYVTKPFSVRELLLRLAVILKRHQGGGEPPGLVTFGRLNIDRQAMRVRVDGNEVDLTPIEFKLLLNLCDRQNRVQSRATLLEDVWETSSDITTRTVDTHVKRLREKIGPAGAYIETVRGFGYRFCADPGPNE